MNSNPWKMEIGKILVEEHFLEFSTFKVIKAPSLLRRYLPHHDFHVGGRKNLLIFVKVSPDILTRPLDKQSVMWQSREGFLWIGKSYFHTIMIYLDRHFSQPLWRHLFWQPSSLIKRDGRRRIQELNIHLTKRFRGISCWIALTLKRNLQISIMRHTNQSFLVCANLPPRSKELGHGITQPSLHLLAEYCTCGL